MHYTKILNALVAASFTLLGASVQAAGSTVVEPGKQAPADRSVAASRDNLAGITLIGWNLDHASLHSSTSPATDYSNSNHPSFNSALISLEQADFDGSNSALTFTVLSLLSAAVCLKKENRRTV